MKFYNIEEQEIPKQFGIVTFLDILGWKGIWRRELNPISNLQVIIDNLRQVINSNKYPVDVRVISDSILIDSKLNLNEKKIKLPEGREKIIETLFIHYELSSQIISQSIDKHIPVRGATSIGEYSIMGNTFVGDAIDEVASWYETANWVGVFMTPSIIYLLKEIDFDTLSKDKNWVLYPTTPFKKEVGKFETYSVNWIKKWGVNSKDIIDSLKSSFWDQNSGIFPPEITSKIENTIKFAKFIKKK